MTTVLHVQTGTNSTGPFNTGTGSGWYDGSLNSGHSCGTIQESPPLLGSVTLNMIGTSSVGPNNTFAIVAEGAQPQDLFTSCAFTDGEGIPRVFASAGAASYSTTDFPGFTVWRWAPTPDPQNPGSGASFVPVTFMSFVAPSIIQDVPDAINATEVQLSWTPTIGTGPNAGDFLDMEVLRDGDRIADLTADAVDYLDQTAQPGETYTYRIQALYNNGSFPLVVNTLDQTVTMPDMTDEFNCDCELVSEYDTLLNVRKKMLIRLGYPNQLTNPPPGMATLVDQFLRDAQDEIYIQLQRASLRTQRFFRWTMVPGQRYYGIDASEGTCDFKLNPEKITWVGFEDLNQAWYRLDAGIPPEYYTRANINFGWPTCYEIRSCIEIFPAPQAAYTLWIKGDFGVAPLVADDDRFTIDDKMVFLLALGNAKAHYGQKDAQLVLTQAGNYTKSIVAGAHGTKRYVPRGEVPNPWTPPKFLPLGNEPS